MHACERFARREMGIPALPNRKSVACAFSGSILIASEFLVWAPYFYLKYAAQTSVEVMDFLPFSPLSGVFGGLLFLVINHMTTRNSRAE
ncbi:MAG: hypothetical protein MZV64_17215 [Ignavibacteriales bacterium]|nr:hypothetical protein [Ignavibacteriales bacterium]